MDHTDTSELILIALLENAVSHEGKAQEKAAIGRLIAHDKNLRSEIKALMPKIVEVKNEIESWTLEKQKQVLKEKNPSFFEKSTEERS